MIRAISVIDLISLKLAGICAHQLQKLGLSDLKSAQIIVASERDFMPLLREPIPLFSKQRAHLQFPLCDRHELHAKAVGHLLISLVV